MRVAAPAPAPPRPVLLGGFEKEQEDVALGLLMLSRDTGVWRSPVKAETFEKPEQKKKKATAKQPPPLPLPRNGYGYGYNSDEDSALLQYGGGGGDVAKSRKQRPRATPHVLASCPFPATLAPQASPPTAHLAPLTLAACGHGVRPRRHAEVRPRHDAAGGAGQEGRHLPDAAAGGHGGAPQRLL